MLAHLELPYERIPISVTNRSNREELLAGKNPALRIPVLRLEAGRFLGESNAIIWYLGTQEGRPTKPSEGPSQKTLRVDEVSTAQPDFWGRAAAAIRFR